MQMKLALIALQYVIEGEHAFSILCSASLLFVIEQIISYAVTIALLPKS
jgi:hypothetical protein